MAHKLAHTDKRPRGPAAYYREGDEPGWVRLRLRNRFLDEVEAACPEAMAEYRALAALIGTPGLPAALAAWAQKYHLDAEWVIDAAAAGLRIGSQGGPSKPFIVAVYGSPKPATEMEYTWWSYDGTENPARYRARHLAAFTQMLDAQIAEATRELEADTTVVREKFIDKRTLASLRYAAEWQTTGGASGGDPRTILDVLERIGLPPRPGLATCAI